MYKLTIFRIFLLANILTFSFQAHADMVHTFHFPINCQGSAECEDGRLDSSISGLTFTSPPSKAELVINAQSDSNMNSIAKFSNVQLFATYSNTGTKNSCTIPNLQFYFNWNANLEIICLGNLDLSDIGNPKCNSSATPVQSSGTFKCQTNGQSGSNQVSLTISGS